MSTWIILNDYVFPSLWECMCALGHADTHTLSLCISLCIYTFLFIHIMVIKSLAQLHLWDVGPMISYKSWGKMKCIPTDNHNSIICFPITLHLVLHIQRTKEGRALELGSQWSLCWQDQSWRHTVGRGRVFPGRLTEQFSKCLQEQGKIPCSLQTLSQDSALTKPKVSFLWLWECCNQPLSDHSVWSSISTLIEKHLNWGVKGPWL